MSAWHIASTSTKLYFQKHSQATHRTCTLFAISDDIFCALFAISIAHYFYSNQDQLLFSGRDTMTYTGDRTGEMRIPFKAKT